MATFEELLLDLSIWCCVVLWLVVVNRQSENSGKTPTHLNAAPVQVPKLLDVTVIHASVSGTARRYADTLVRACFAAHLSDFHTNLKVFHARLEMSNSHSCTFWFLSHT
jgi:hypothetical protein